MERLLWQIVREACLVSNIGGGEVSCLVSSKQHWQRRAMLASEERRAAWRATEARQANGEITVTNCEREQEGKEGLREKRGGQLRERNMRGERKKGD